MTDISIVIPTYNRSKFIAEAIQSCYAAADGLRLQVVVVDDASTDASEEVIRRYPVEYIRFEKNCGRRVARNTGKENSVGLYLKYLDSDDVLEPSSLRKEFDLAVRSGADIVVGGWHSSEYSKDGTERIVGTCMAPRFENIIDDILAGKAVPTGAALYRRDFIRDVAWAAVGPLDDWDYFIHAAIKNGTIVSLPDPVYRWRHHDGERVSGKSMVVTAQSFYRVLDRLHECLVESEQLSEPRRRRLAQYYYKELRVLFRFKSELASKVEKTIHSLDARFLPIDEERSRVIRMLARVFPLHWLMVGYGVGRRILDKLDNS